MDNVLGSLVFAGIVVAQFVAVVAVSKWNASTAATDNLHHGAVLSATNVRQVARRIDRLNESRRGRKIMIGISGRWKFMVLQFFARWRAARSAARDRRIRRIAENGPFTIE